MALSYGIVLRKHANQLKCLQVLSMAVRHRRVGSHELNMESSRSHSIFTGEQVVAQANVLFGQADAAHVASIFLVGAGNASS